MHFKDEIVERVYNLYLRGTSLECIGAFMDLADKDVDEIIDYMNEIFN